MPEVVPPTLGGRVLQAIVPRRFEVNAKRAPGKRLEWAPRRVWGPEQPMTPEQALRAVAALYGGLYMLGMGSFMALAAAIYAIHGVSTYGVAAAVALTVATVYCECKGLLWLIFAARGAVVEVGS